MIVLPERALVKLESSRMRSATFSPPLPPRGDRRRASTAGSMIAAERSSSTMADAADEIPGQPDARAAPEGHLRVRGDERMHWHFIPTDDVSAERPDDQGDERTAAQARARPAKAGLSQRGYLTAIVDHGSRNRARRARGGAARRGASRRAARRSSATRSATSSRSSARRRRQDTWGWRVEGHHISLHFTVVNGTLVAGVADVLRHEPGRGARRPEERAAHARRRGGRGARAAAVARRAQRAKAIIDATAPSDMLTMANVNIDPLSPAGIAADAMNATQRELLMKLIDVYTGFMARRHRRRAHGADARRRASRRSASPGPARPSAARSTTTASRARRSSSSTTTRRTTATTSTRCGATSTATSGAICCAST